MGSFYFATNGRAIRVAINMPVFSTVVYKKRFRIVRPEQQALDVVLLRPGRL
jgi:hypothetical protein